MSSTPVSLERQSWGPLSEIAAWAQLQIVHTAVSSFALGAYHSQNPKEKLEEMPATSTQAKCTGSIHCE